MAMTMSGDFVLPADKDTVWAKLNDADVLRVCIPGCQSLEKTPLQPGQKKLIAEQSLQLSTLGQSHGAADPQQAIGDDGHGVRCGAAACWGCRRSR